MASFKCTGCSFSFEDEINGIVCCPDCGKVMPLPPNLTEDQLEKIYNEAILVMGRAKRSANIEETMFIFEQLGDYADSAEQVQRCRIKLIDAQKDEKFALAMHKMELETVRAYREAIAIFEELGEWKGSSFKADEARVKLQALIEKNEKRKDLIFKITMIVSAIVLVLGLLAWIIIQYLVPAIRYSWALSRIEKEQYDKGYAILEDLGDYKEAPMELKKSKYNRALLYETTGDLLNACDFYDQARGYSDADARLYNVCKSLTIEQQLSVLGVGSPVILGVYEQNSEVEGKEAIEWIIVDKKDDGKVLLVSKYVLEGTPYSYSAGPWGKSELCAWLNTSFLTNSFASADRSNILEQNISTIYRDNEGNEKVDLITGSIFLLSDSEARQYFKTDDDRCAPATQHLVGSPVHINEGNGCAHYWLRTTTPDGNVMYINGAGGVNEEGKLGEHVLGVRPAMWVTP